MATEAPIQNEIRLDVAAFDVHLYRNNSGAFKNDRGQWVRFGLANDSAKVNKTTKSSDLIGFRPLLITPEMVGRVVPVFSAIDAKPPGWVFRQSDDRSVAQLKFIDHVKRYGGFAGFATSVQEARDILWLGQD